MDHYDLDLSNMTRSTDGSQSLESTVQTIKYSLMVLIYLGIRDVMKYAVPLIKAFIADKLKTV
jgi:hypothetical protein